MSADSTNQRKKQQSILCIDDDKDTCDLIVTLLGLNNYQVVAAYSVHEGMKLARQGNFDLFLIDFYFDNSNGVALCQYIRTFDKKTPIIFCSGESRGDRISLALKSGAQDYLIKPLKSNELLEKVAQYLGNAEN